MKHREKDKQLKLTMDSFNSMKIKFSGGKQQTYMWIYLGVEHVQDINPSCRERSNYKIFHMISANSL